MIQRASAGQSPETMRQDQSLHPIPMRPPTIPKSPRVTTSLGLVSGQVLGLEKSRASKKDCFSIAVLPTENPEGRSLGQKNEREFVFLVTKGGSDLLKKGCVPSVIFNDILDPSDFALEAEL